MTKTERWKDLKHNLDNLIIRAWESWEYIVKIMLTLENKSWYNVENKNKIIMEYIQSNIGNKSGNDRTMIQVYKIF